MMGEPGGSERENGHTRGRAVPGAVLTPSGARETLSPHSSGEALGGGGGDDRSIRLLLVEDDPESSQALKTVLEKRQVVVTTVAEGEEALRCFHEQSFDVVVADICLQGISGVELLRRIREDRPDFPVILLTGFDSLESAVQAVKLGAQDYILKPLDGVDDLLLPVAKAVRHHRLLVRNRLLEEDRRRAQEELESSHAELRAVSARLVETEEAERKRLGRELHDQVGRNLTTLACSLVMAGKQLPKSGGEDAARCLADALLQIEGMAEQIRHLVFELRPSELDDYGLPAALRWYGEYFSQRTGIPVDVRAAELKSRPASNVETALFRIAQEALNNVAKHAHAGQVTVTLDETEKGVCLVIADDGIGCDATAAGKGPARSGWGLRSMKERAVAVGGRMSVHSQSGQGVRVVVETEVSP